MRASGRPTIMAASTAALTIGMICGHARPTSSHAQTISLRQADGRSPASSSRARWCTAAVGVGSAHRFLKRRKDVVMLVAAAVVAERAALRQLPRERHRDDRFLSALRRNRAELRGVHRLAHVAAARHCDVCGHAVLQPERKPALLCEEPESALDRADYLLALDRLELEDRRAAQDRVVHVEVRVFRRGGDQRDAAVFDELEQRLLLFLIEILDLIQI